MTKSLLLLFLTLPAAPLQAQGLSATAAARFLSQASWGATPASVAALQSLNPDPKTAFTQYIISQLQTPASSLDDVAIVPPATTASFTPAQAQFFYNAVNGNDQLRQRVAFALSQIWVVSGTKITDPNQFLPYYRLLLNDSLTNYLTLMYDVTLNPAMGHYLDMVNNDAVPANSTKEANENYAREIMQLFTVGTEQLNEDGTRPVDAQGAAIATYSQTVVEGMARVFTGWTYAPATAGTVSTGHNPANFASPMVAVEKLHDATTKTVIGTNPPSYQTTLAYQGSADADLRSGLGLLFKNPNLPPFVCKNLIQHLVTSNPSPAYVQRVVNAFKGLNGVRGDLPTVILAILLDPEARAGDDGSAPISEHLREPVLYIASLMRTLGAPVTTTNTLASSANNMGQNLFFSPSVFNYYSPNYVVPTTSSLGPEFQTYSTSSSIVRGNFVNTLVYGTTLGLNLTPYQNAATVSDLEALIQNNFYFKPMSAGLKAAIENTYASIVPASQSASNLAAAAKARAQAALYLAAVAPEYQVQN